MMNDFLRDLVVEEKIAVFIDDIMIATETEEGHDEIVEEVLRRLVAFLITTLQAS